MRLTLHACQEETVPFEEVNVTVVSESGMNVVVEVTDCDAVEVVKISEVGCARASLEVVTCVCKVMGIVVVPWCCHFLFWQETGLVTVHGVGNLKEIACEGGRKRGADDELENQPHPDEGTESACLQVAMVKVGAEDEGIHDGVERPSCHHEEEVLAPNHPLSSKEEISHSWEGAINFSFVAPI
jgi:hypothetical protein